MSAFNWHAHNFIVSTRGSRSRMQIFRSCCKWKIDGSGSASMGKNNFTKVKRVELNDHVNLESLEICLRLAAHE